MDRNAVEGVSKVSDALEAGNAEGLPNDDEPSFNAVGVGAAQNIADEGGEGKPATCSSGEQVPSDSEEVLVTIPEHLHASGFKTITQILIPVHGQTLGQGNVTPGLLTPQTPLTPLTPSTPGSAGTDKGAGFRYNWDQSVNEPILPVRCKNRSGELHKAKFGSGGRGKCIKVSHLWYTPNEFEALGGRAGSKDWKRSIRYGGRTLQCLIEEGILNPHATSCTCAACCDDVSVSGPIRLFVPYKRRKGRPDGSNSERKLLPKEPGKSLPSPQIKESPTFTLQAAPSFTLATPVVTDKVVQVASTEVPVTVVSVAGSEIISTLPQNPKPTTVAATVVDFTEQKQWWQMEEMANSIINYGQQLKTLLEQAKAQSMASKEVALHQLRVQMEAERKEALQSLKEEHNLNLQKIVMQKKSEKSLRGTLQADTVDSEENSNQMDEDIKHCANCNRQAFSECTGCHKIHYCSQFCQCKDWNNHESECKQQTIVLIETVSSD